MSYVVRLKEPKCVYTELPCNIPDCELCTLNHFPYFKSSWDKGKQKRWFEQYMKLFYRRTIEPIER